MKKLLLFIFLSWFTIIAVAQRPSLPAARGSDQEVSIPRDTTQKPPITAYKIITVRGDTTYVDTSLAIYKDYRFNYLRKDNFELLPFVNVGQTYTSLGYNFKREELIPDIGARARHFHFMDVDDIKYYEVPTPLTELYFKTVPEQGQNLDAFFTINTSPQLNFSIAYKGLRSLGNYQNALTSTGHFRSTVSYSTLNKRYRMNAHFVSQDLLNRENGGLNEVALEQYISKQEDFEDRSILEVKFENAENVLFGKRFYMDHGFDLVQSRHGFIGLHHKIDFSDKKYVFRQAAPFSGFGEALRNSNLNDEVRLRNIENIVSLSLQNNSLGHLAVKGGHTYYNYGYNSLIFIGDQAVTNRLRGQNYSAGAQYSNNIGPVSVYGNAILNLAGDFSGHFLTAGGEFRLTPENIVNVEINSNERSPNFNFILYQSDYLNYNWQNDFENEASRVL
ncbi:MAG TPA: putative porin, partial [Gillisia sp.]|nr:putative porin [Gillisia sp.]